jgi:hypothetical protein
MKNYLGCRPCTINSIGKLVINLIALSSLNLNKLIYK